MQLFSDRTARRIGDLGGLERVLNSIDILGILPQHQAAEKNLRQTLSQPPLGTQIMRRQGHQQQLQQPRHRNIQVQEVNVNPLDWM